MASKEEVRNILSEGLDMEAKAERLCADILEYAHLNGFTAAVGKIKNDEVEHQQIVKHLLEMAA